MVNYEISNFYSSSMVKKYQTDENGNRVFVEAIIKDNKGNVIKKVSFMPNVVYLGKCVTLYQIPGINECIIINGDKETIKSVMNFHYQDADVPFKLTPFLQNHGLIIVRDYDREYLVNYLLGKKLTPGYGEIEEYDERLFVKAFMPNLENDEVNDYLNGEISLNGILIDGCMTFQNLRESVYINPAHFDEEMETTRKKYPRLVRKKQKKDRQKEFIEWEYQQYLKRKEKKSGL